MGSGSSDVSLSEKSASGEDETLEEAVAFAEALEEAFAEALEEAFAEGAEDPFAESDVLSVSSTDSPSVVSESTSAEGVAEAVFLLSSNFLASSSG